MSEAVENTRESISSVELTRNAKGGTQIKVKVYDEDPDKAAKKAQEIYNQACKDNDAE